MRRPNSRPAPVLRFLALVAGLVAGLVAPAASRLGAAELFSDLVGPVKVAPVAAGGRIQVPFITWGGDVATFHANGDLRTRPGTIFARHGLDLDLVPGDDFPAQVQRYLGGQSPFLRGTFSMIGQASEVIGSDPRTRPVVFLQMTWSSGDHLVSRAHVRTLDQLRGKKVALQRGGPHVGMLDDILRTAGLGWSDVTVVWMKNLTGADSAVELFRKDASVDAAFAISPDMIGLTGGLDSKGSGAEGTVKDAQVLVSTNNMKRSIADVYACRKDWFDAHRDVVEKFAAGYLKACEEVLALKEAFEKKDARSSGRYVEILKLTQKIYGAEVIPTLEVDAHGLVSDCRYVGLPGNVAFFTQEGNLDGFQAKQRLALDLAVGQGYARTRKEFLAPELDYQKLAALGGLTRTSASEPRVPAEVTRIDPALELDDKTIFSFTIEFEPNQNEFTDIQYGKEFQRALEQASLFGNSVIAIRGHADPTMTLREVVRAGLEKGVLKRSGTAPDYQYYFEGRPLDLSDTTKIIKLIEGGGLAGAEANPLQTLQAALNLSRTRAEAVRNALIAFARGKDIILNESQFQPVGVGILEPLIAKPRNMDEAKRNMRVEFRLINVPAETVNPGDFDF